MTKEVMQQVTEQAQPAFRDWRGEIVDVLCDEEFGTAYESPQATQPVQPSQAGELSDDDCRDIYNSAMDLPNRSIVSVMRYIIAHTAAQPVQPSQAQFLPTMWQAVW